MLLSVNKWFDRKKYPAPAGDGDLPVAVVMIIAPTDITYKALPSNSVTAAPQPPAGDTHASDFDIIFQNGTRHGR
jgi:hypothetical protein